MRIESLGAVVVRQSGAKADMKSAVRKFAFGFEGWVMPGVASLLVDVGRQKESFLGPLFIDDKVCCRLINGTGK
jgi:hypothetical protein